MMAQAQQTGTPSRPKRVFTYGAHTWVEGEDFAPDLTDQHVQEALARHYKILQNATMSAPIESGEGDERTATRSFEAKMGTKGAREAAALLHLQDGLVGWIDDVAAAPPEKLLIWDVLDELDRAGIEQQVLMGHALSVAHEEGERAEKEAAAFIARLLA